MKNVLRFWLGKGADGFRVDAIPHLVETVDEDGSYPDEEVIGTDPEDYGYTSKEHTRDLQLTYDRVYEWRKVIDDFQKENGGDTRVMLTEAYASVEMTMKYFGEGDKLGSHMPFNFFMISDLDEKSTARNFKASIDTWMDNMPQGKTANWVLGNHDKWRIPSRLGEKKADAINILLRMLPGVGVTYNGEEIGMINNDDITYEETEDPQACNGPPEDYKKNSRDPARTPFQWDNTKNAGFTTGDKTWLPVQADYINNNLAQQKSDKKSHFKVFQRISEARRTETVKRGSMNLKVISEYVLAFTRDLRGYDSFVVLLNLGDKAEDVNLQEAFATLSDKLVVFAASVNSEHEIGDDIPTEKINLKPFEALVFHTSGASVFHG